jgi:gamma-glutamyltranspeptidase/glutathione hydrolase
MDLTFFARLVATAWDLQRVIELPMFHTDSFYRSFLGHYWYSGRIAVEENLGSDPIAALDRRGHDVRLQPAWQLGRVCAVGQNRATGLIRAAANPRGLQGYAMGR